MYGIPEEFDLSSIVGQMIERISIGPFILHIEFGNGWTMTCEGTVAYRNASGEAVIRDQEWRDLDLLRESIGGTVDSWRIESHRTFAVSLVNRGAMVFKDDSNEYENFQNSPAGWII